MTLRDTQLALRARHGLDRPDRTMSLAVEVFDLLSDLSSCDRTCALPAEVAPVAMDGVLNDAAMRAMEGIHRGLLSTSMP
jgi:hypothetical protein